jgi:hypothetical protein
VREHQLAEPGGPQHPLHLTAVGAITGVPALIAEGLSRSLEAVG